MKKRLLMMFRSVFGPQGPTKPELLKLATPAPWVPSKATTSFQVTVLFSPTWISVSMVSHESEPPGRVPSYESASYDSVVGRPQQKVNPLGELIVGLNVAVAGSFLQPQASARCPQSIQKSALVNRLKYVYVVGFCLELVRVRYKPFISMAYFQSPLLAELARLMDPSHPPMQSWNAALTNLRISIPLVGLTKKRESILVRMTSI